MKDPAKLEARFWSKVDKSAGPGGCWIWTGAKNSVGYGTFNNDGLIVVAHKWLWSRTTGAYNDSLKRLCTNNSCVNPLHLQKEPNTLERFWQKIDSTNLAGCWLWLGKTDKDGYGSFAATHKVTERAHRYSYSLFFGTIPESLCVCHTCDNPGCVRPDHLFLGTIQDNNNDKMKKNRQARGETIARSARLRVGEKANHHVLSTVQRDELLRLRRAGWLQKDLAAKFDVGQSQVGRICRGESRVHG